MENILTESTTPEVKTYEVGYLLTPFLPAEQVEEVAQAMYKSLIEDLGGKALFKTTPKMRPLAYPVSKIISNKKSTVSEAYFGAVKFEIFPEQIRTIKEILDKDDRVIRFLIIGIPKNSERIVFTRRPAAKVEEGAVKGEEMNKEEIDKEIEGLLEPATDA